MDQNAKKVNGNITTDSAVSNKEGICQWFWNVKSGKHLQNKLIYLELSKCKLSFFLLYYFSFILWVRCGKLKEDVY